ncbi:hypothetical protein R1flu_019113 [Riccia fluitans]|uniref:Protein kinase domain-containing protein n=1 Tax=Riccia fluitans TaxID=41844 RepID=A0ABD1ZHS2_9MARC
MEALTSSSYRLRGRAALGQPCLSTKFLGDGIPSKWKCKVATQSRKYFVAALSSGNVSAAVSESLGQLQSELTHQLAALGLPLQAYGEENSVWWAVAVAPLAWWYLFATPGSIGGFVDYMSTPVHSQTRMSYDAEEVEVGRQIGQGSFGVVYEGYIGRGNRKGSQPKEIRVILKKVKPGIGGAAQMHATEEYMNRRVKRTAPKACAEYLGTTLVSRQQVHGRLTEGLWLIWKFEGGRTLDYYLKQRNFPDNVAEYILGSEISTRAGRVEQSNAVIRRIMFQLLSNLRDLHHTGLVHRDVKPLNLILAEDEGTFKLIDLGACVDVRSGYNYVPEETIIDPTYAAPEHHIMPTSTPQLPPDPLCSLISPFVWALNTPDRFDLYSAGLIMLQMSVKPLRQDMTLYSFNNEFKRTEYDLNKWRKKCRFSDEDFELLDADGGAGWELVKSMLQPRYDKELAIWLSFGSSRPSAEAALKHSFFSRSFIKFPSLATSFSIKDFDFPSLTVGRVRESSKPVVSASPGRPERKEVGVRSRRRAVPSVTLSSVQPQLEVDTSQILSALGALTQPALVIGACWLVFSGLRSTALATYALGQLIAHSVGISGTAFVAFVLIIKPWLEAQKDREANSEGYASGDAGVSFSRNIVDQKTPLQDSRAEALLIRAQRDSSTHRQSYTGLVEAVKEMELQLESLEGSIFLEREYANQQQERILQLEKLIRTPDVISKLRYLRSCSAHWQNPEVTKDRYSPCLR